QKDDQKQQQKSQPSQSPEQNKDQQNDQKPPQKRPGQMSEEEARQILEALKENDKEGVRKHAQAVAPRTGNPEDDRGARLPPPGRVARRGAARSRPPRGSCSPVHCRPCRRPRRRTRSRCERRSIAWS